MREHSDMCFDLFAHLDPAELNLALQTTWKSVTQVDTKYDNFAHRSPRAWTDRARGAICFAFALIANQGDGADVLARVNRPHHSDGCKHCN